jgi:hypothetical protein
MPYIGKSPHFGVRDRFIFVASANDTSVSGADANGATLKFSDGAYVDVYLNGVLLKPTTDYNTNTANTIAGLSALSANDEITVIVFDVFAVGDTVSASSGGTFSGAVTHTAKSTVNIASSGNAIDFKLGGTTIGNVGVISDRVYLTAEGSHGVYLDASANNFCPSSTTGTDNNGNIDLGASFARWKDIHLAGNVVVGTAGKGIDFSAVTNAGTMTSELLDAYEEGTWTPTYRTADGASITVNTYNRQHGRYTRIGRNVFCRFSIGTTSVTFNNGQVDHNSNHRVQMDGLPFTASNDSINGGGCSGVFSSMGSVTTGVGFLINNDSTIISLRNMGDTGSYNGNFVDDIYTAQMRNHSSGEGNMLTGQFFYQTE